MSKTWLVTPAFCKSALLHDCLAHIHKTGIPKDVEHIVIDGHYPVNKSANRKEIKLYADAFGCRYVDSGKDLGLHEGINNAARVCGIGPEDIVVGCDPDNRPSPNFVTDLDAVMRADPTIAVLGATFWVIEEPRIQNIMTETVIAGRRVWNHPGIEMWTACAFNWSFVTRAGGLSQTHALYGGLESAMSPAMRSQGMRLAYLADTQADSAPVDTLSPLLFDPEYRSWKDAHIAGFKGGLEQWLREFKPERLG